MENHHNREGYKKTKLGWIPKNWSINTFDNISYRSRKKCDFKEKSILNLPCIELEHIEQETGNINGYAFFTTQKSLKNNFQKGDILFGKLRPYLKKFWFAKFDGACSSEIWILRGKNDIENMFLFYLIQSSRFINASNKTTGTKMPRADWEIVSSTLFSIPPLPEQKKIAKIQLKKGLMQQLLTGKVRFREFVKKKGFKDTQIGRVPEDWGVIKLKEKISKFIVPMRDKPKRFGGNIPWCRIEDFEGKYLFHSKSNQMVNQEIIKEWNLKIHPIGTILCSCSANLGICAIVGQPLVTNQTFIGLLPSSQLENEYLFYIMSFYSKRLQILSSGTTIAYLSRKKFENFKIPYPTFLEQKMIAKILSQKDVEIIKLQHEKEILKEQKKGLMQQLLTGKTRVKIEET